MVNIGFISFYLCLKIEKDHDKRIFKLKQLVIYINQILPLDYLDQAKPSNILIKKKHYCQVKQILLSQSKNNIKRKQDL